MFIRDAAAATSREVTPEGFLRVRARIGRAGMHDYTAAEIGLPAGFAPGDPVRVYRPPEEVFDQASMDSFRSKPITDDHPPEMVNARNWKRYAIGHSGHEVVREGDHLATDLIITDAAGAERASAGAELSNGYHADFEFGLGVTPDGEPYDAVQRNIRGNHVALVAAGRCGGTCRIGDSRGGSCGCQAADAPGIGVDDVAALRTQLRDAEEAHSLALEAKDGVIAALMARVPDQAALDGLVAERADVLEAARRALGPSFQPQGRSSEDIRRQVVGRLLGPERLRDRSDAYVAAAFDTLRAAPAVANPLASHLATGLHDASASREASLATRNRYLTRAWKGDITQGDA